jgi:hypothetical protein
MTAPTLLIALNVSERALQRDLCRGEGNVGDWGVANRCIALPANYLAEAKVKPSLLVLGHDRRRGPFPVPSRRLPPIAKQFAHRRRSAKGLRN